MAPEIGQGRYDCSIDIYALGILLYEMLTGQVPFFGASPAEILMKHMTDQPDLTGIEEPFARVIRKALAKDPAERYKTVQEMVEDVFGQEHIRNSVSQFRPEDLSVIAERVAAKAQVQKPLSRRRGPQPGPRARRQGQPVRPTAKGQDLGHGPVWRGTRPQDRLRRRPDRREAGMCCRGLERHLAEKASGPDSISRRQRRILAAVVMAVISLGVGAVESRLAGR